MWASELRASQTDAAAAVLGQSDTTIESRTGWPGPGRGGVEGMVENKGLKPVDTQEPGKHRDPSTYLHRQLSPYMYLYAILGRKIRGDWT